jgi:hypothetical protein
MADPTLLQRRQQVGTDNDVIYNDGYWYSDVRFSPGPSSQFFYSGRIFPRAREVADLVMGTYRMPT